MGKSDSLVEKRQKCREVGMKRGLPQENLIRLKDEMEKQGFVGKRKVERHLWSGEMRKKMGAYWES